jgi:hypothetical protein
LFSESLIEKVAGKYFEMVGGIFNKKYHVQAESLKSRHEQHSFWFTELSDTHTSNSKALMTFTKINLLPVEPNIVRLFTDAIYECL